MTPEQTKAITACIEAFNIPRDCEDFSLRIFRAPADIYGRSASIAAHLEVDHFSASPSEV